MRRVRVRAHGRRGTAGVRSHARNLAGRKKKPESVRSFVLRSSAYHDAFMRMAQAQGLDRSRIPYSYIHGAFDGGVPVKEAVMRLKRNYRQTGKYGFAGEK